MNSKAWMVAAAMLAAGSAQATCFKVYAGDGKLILESSTTPVNLSLPLGDTVPQKFGNGAFMTISDLAVFCKDRRGDAGAQATVAALQLKARAPKLKGPNSPEAKELEAQLQALEAQAGGDAVKPEAGSTQPQEQGAAPEAAEKVAAE
jgi:hypothetical protein